MVERYSCSRLKTQNFKIPWSWGCSRVQRGVKFTVNSTNSKSRKRDELNWTASLWMLFDMTQWWNEQRKANPRNSHAASWCIPIQTALKVASTLQPPAYNSSYAQWKSYDSYVSGTNTSSLSNTLPDLPMPATNLHWRQGDAISWTQFPGHSTPHYIYRNIIGLCPIQCVFIFHVSCQASYTMSAIGFW